MADFKLNKVLNFSPCSFLNFLSKFALKCFINSYYSDVYEKLKSYLKGDKKKPMSKNW